jgi:putative ABC transport system permease protein
MLKNYIKIVFRNAFRNPVYFFINISGLAMGMCVTILILLFVQHELTYDRYHENSDDIYRVSREWFNQDGETSLHLGHVAPPFGPLLKADFEDVVRESVRFLNQSALIKAGDESFIEERFFFADPEVFNIFSWEVIQGDPETALTYPDGIILTQSTARRYFGNEDPMGKPLEAGFGDLRLNLQVRGIVEDIPGNSHFSFDMLASMEPVASFYGGIDQMMQNYGSNNFSTFLLLNENVNYRHFEAQLPGFIDKYISANSQNIPASESTQLNLWPLTDIHLHSNLDSEIEANSSIEYVYIYLAIALFILLIACINFMNLSTARSSKRALEVGLRKVMGADRRVLMRQFIGETVIMSFISLIAALLLVEMVLPAFSAFTGKELSFSMIDNTSNLAAMFVLIITVGVIAGSYPAFFLSAFEPATVLKGSFKVGSVHKKVRSALVTGQFAISIILIVSVVVVNQQLQFMKSKDLGFDRTDILVLPASDHLIRNYDSVRERLVRHSGIVNVSMASRVPSGRLLDSQGTRAEVNNEITPINIRIADIHVSHSFLETFDIDIIQGRNFDFNLASDSTESFLLNESAVRAIGWQNPEEAIGKQFLYGNRRGYVIGVMKDFHFESLHQSIAPIVFMIPQNRISSVAVKLRAGQRMDVINYLQDEWASLRPDYPFTYYFVEDNFEQQYAAEKKLGQIFGFFAMLAIIIAVMGLYGLVAFSTQQRFREIGIRKILGSTVSGILALLTKDFLKLIGLGFLIGVPVAWYSMNLWLHEFAYRIEIGSTAFLIAGGIVFFIAIVTITVQSIKAAMMNPVKSLRSE